MEVERETPRTEGKQRDENVPPEYNVLHHILKQYKVIMPIKKMVEQSPCCIMFFQELLKTRVDISKEELISLTSKCHNTYEVPTKVRFDGEGCFTLPIYVRGEYIGHGLCDSGANANLMSLTKARELGNVKISPHPYTIAYANGKEEKAIVILKDFQINIGGLRLLFRHRDCKHQRVIRFFANYWQEFFCLRSNIRWRTRGNYHYNFKAIRCVRCDSP